MSHCQLLILEEKYQEALKGLAEYVEFPGLSQKVRKSFDVKDFIYSSMGEIAATTKDYSSALEYYNKALA